MDAGSLSPLSQVSGRPHLKHRNIKLVCQLLCHLCLVSLCVLRRGKRGYVNTGLRQETAKSDEDRGAKDMRVAGEAARGRTT